MPSKSVEQELIHRKQHKPNPEAVFRRQGNDQQCHQACPADGLQHPPVRAGGVVDDLALYTSMLYPVLHWMEDQGLVEAEWKETETGRKRKYYQLRKEGRKALAAERQQWLTVHATLTQLWKTQPHLS